MFRKGLAAGALTALAVLAFTGWAGVGETAAAPEPADTALTLGSTLDLSATVPVSSRRGRRVGRRAGRRFGRRFARGFRRGFFRSRRRFFGFRRFRRFNRRFARYRYWPYAYYPYYYYRPRYYYYDPYCPIGLPGLPGPSTPRFDGKMRMIEKPPTEYGPTRRSGPPADAYDYDGGPDDPVPMPRSKPKILPKPRKVLRDVRSVPAHSLNAKRT
jgi:hypothetical protein